MLVRPAHKSRGSRFFAGALVPLAIMSCGTDSPTALLRVESVSIFPGTLALYEGQVVSIRAIARDHHGVALPARQVAWHIDDTTVATVNYEGTLYAWTPGTARVTATIAGVTGVASLTVKRVPVSRIVLDPGPLPLAVRETRMLRATPEDSGAQPLNGRAVRFETSDSTVVSVTGDGMLTGVAPGAARIIVTSDGLSASVQIPVAWGALETLSLMPSRIILIAGDSGRLIPTGWDVRGYALPGQPATSYVSSNPTVMTVTSNGLVTAVAPGQATVTATAAGKLRTVRADVIAPTSGTWVRFDDEHGELQEFNARNAIISLSSYHAHLTLRVGGGGDVQGEIELPRWFEDFVPGYYPDLGPTMYESPTTGAMTWTGAPGGCSEYTNSLTIASAVTAGDELTSIDFSFEEGCSGGGRALRGTVHWRGNEAPIVPGPVVPIPAGLWTPPATLVPATPDNRAVFESDSGDFVGAGKVYSYSAPPASMGASLNEDYDGRVFVGLDQGDTAFWRAEFQPMYGRHQLEAGYYPDVGGLPLANPLNGGMLVSTHSSCNVTRGWFAVDTVAYLGGRITALDIRFEQHCEGAAPALHGMLHWRAAAGASTGASSSASTASLGRSAGKQWRVARPRAATVRQGAPR